MKIAKRLKRLIEIDRLPPPYLNKSIITEEEWEQILSGQLPLTAHQAVHLAEWWGVPVSYFNDYDKNDLVTFRQLQLLQHALLTNSSEAADIVEQLDQPWRLSDVTQEVIFHLLKSIHLYKRNQQQEAERIEKEYLLFMLPAYNVLKESSVFQKALFYYYGVKYYSEGNREESFAYFERLLEKTKNPDEVISIMQNLALILRDSKDYDLAIDYMKRLSEYSKAHKRTRGLSIAWNYLGVFYMWKEIYPKALQYFEQMGTLDLDPLTESRRQNNLAIIYKKTGKYTDALKGYRQAIRLQQEYNLKEGLFHGYINITNMYLALDDISAADMYRKKAIQEAADEWEESLAKQMQAKILERTDINRAITVYEELIAYYENHQIKRKLDEIYPVLAMLYEKKAKQLQEKYERLHKAESDITSKNA
ncbi:tetratricopeptide repeat protein [Thalassobacillus devorans]|uniref:tetratricopeptide repeat protein n=1 Tax=Thalassobacillus devorans TaxID=279813 RepID=UPI000A1C7C68|nr:tetratricopeptide repeat protein [Thalassobacillus devorans]